jgi:hypothetical protein
MKYKTTHAMALMFLMSIGASTTFADFYQYKDGKGTIHMTNKLESVPEKYRATMKVVREDKPPTQPAPAAAEQTAPAAADQQQASQAKETQPQSRFGQLCSRFPWLKPLLFVGGFLVAFLLVATLTDFLPSPMLARVIMIAFFLGAFVFTYKVYADHLASGYLTMKEKMLTMFKKANEREGLAPEDKPGLPAREQQRQLEELKK